MWITKLYLIITITCRFYSTLNIKVVRLFDKKKSIRLKQITRVKLYLLLLLLRKLSESELCNFIFFFPQSDHSQLSCWSDWISNRLQITWKVLGIHFLLHIITFMFWLRQQAVMNLQTSKVLAIYAYWFVYFRRVNYTSPVLNFPNQISPFKL